MSPSAPLRNTGTTSLDVACLIESQKTPGHPADKRGSPCVVIQGGDEQARGEVQIKDLIEGAKAAAAIASHQEWRESRPAQFAVAEDKLVEAVREVLARHAVKWG